MIPVSQGQLHLGTWQGICLGNTETVHQRAAIGSYAVCRVVKASEDKNHDCVRRVWSNKEPIA